MSAEFDIKDLKNRGFLIIVLNYIGNLFKYFNYFIAMRRAESRRRRLTVNRNTPKLQPAATSR